MDRIQEFKAIVQMTGIPQNEAMAPDSWKEADDVGRRLASSLEEMRKVSPYETYKLHPLISRGQELLKKYRNLQLAGTEEITREIKNIIRLKAIKYNIELNKAARMARKTGNSGADMLDRNGGASAKVDAPAEQTVAQQYDTVIAETIVNSESIQERQRISRQISEIGEIVEDISLQVCLQEENLKRIDHTMRNTEKWSKKAIGELEELWRMTRGNRKTMAIFFLFWFIVFFMFWLSKR